MIWRKNSAQSGLDVQHCSLGLDWAKQNGRAGEKISRELVHLFSQQTSSESRKNLECEIIVPDFQRAKIVPGKEKVLPVQKKSRPRLVCPCSFSILKQRMWYGLVCLSQLATDINQLKKRRGRIFRKVNNWIKIRVGDDEEIARCMEFLFSCLCPSCVRIAGTREQSWKKLWKLNPRLSHIIPIGS